MSLRDMRCDRCHELETALYRAGALGVTDAPWYCQACMEETGQVVDEETERLMRILKERKSEQQ